MPLRKRISLVAAATVAIAVAIAVLDLVLRRARTS